MDKRYQVFVSSTYEDLQEERKEVMQALLELDCIPAGMELFPASNDDQWSLIKKVIDDCDYYLLIIGGKYGSINEEGISYTQMEFEYAKETGKPIISFIIKDPDLLPVKKSEKDPQKKEKLEKFKNDVKKKLVRFWENPENLGSLVSRSMIKLIKQYPAEGWVKSNSAIDETSIKEIARLQKENNELRSKLNSIATEAPSGTEKFSQGDDEISISFTFSAKKENGDDYDYYDCKASHNFTWNELFGCVAPKLIDEGTDYEIERAISTLIEKNKYIVEESKTFKNLIDFKKFEISSDSYELIIIQFKALGLITLSNKKKNTKNTTTYWTLTPYGDFVMTQLLAVKR